MHTHPCFVHTHKHTHAHTQIQTSIQDLQIWAELLKRAIQPSGKESATPALLHRGGSSDLPLPLWSGNYAVMAPS